MSKQRETHEKDRQRVEAEEERRERQEREREQCEADRNRGAEIMLELSEFEASRTCCTITELTVKGIANLEESNSVLMAERDRLMQENAILKESNASLCEEIAILRKL